MRVISARQYMLLICLFIIGSSILYLPSLLTRYAGEAGWISGIVGTVGAMFSILLYVAIYRCMNGLSFEQYLNVTLGTWAGGMLNLLYIAFALILATLNINDMGTFITTQIETATPLVTILIVMTVLGTYAVRVGLEALGRSTEIFFPLICLILIFFTVFLLQDSEIDLIKPYMGFGLFGIAKASLMFMTFPYWEMVLFLVIAPHVSNQYRTIRKAMFHAVWIGGSCITVLTLLCIMCNGAMLTSVNTFPTYRLAQSIEAGGFFGRLEIMMAGIWFVTIFYKITICMYVALVMISRLSGTKDWKPLTWPLALVLVPLAYYVSPNSAFTGHVTTRIIPGTVVFMGFIIPLFLLLLTTIRGQLNRGLRE
ncbi:hypothetical protein SY83_19400 [Paenibacillus swuensis]|uniref:Uncharacterized protein n=2 Tax=Paenibacillus swuensis TaxID=1178515 RepID=A0A172TM12_9BACL|nr:hypothetical protein SY83_19400 [Paenibacillus swuensis]